MWIRIWSGNQIAADLQIDENGYGSWVPRPEMPNNARTLPDLEIDPWRRYVRHQRNDVEFYGNNTEDGDEYSAIDDADEGA